MRISCVQMDMRFADPERNFKHADELIRKAAQTGTDVIVLPETWNTGFFPKENLPELSDCDGQCVRQRIGSLAGEYKVNLVAGSVSNLRGNSVFNTAMVFDRTGNCIASYDKTHLFTPMGEHRFYTAGNSLCRFTLDGISCGLIICYDVRFPELILSLALAGIDLLFVVSQWPDIRIEHLRTLTTARAIENQMFLACCNSCGIAGETRYGGNSAILDPWGKTLALAGKQEEILNADCDFSIVDGIRSSINVFADRRPELYKID